MVQPSVREVGQAVGQLVAWILVVVSQDFQPSSYLLLGLLFSPPAFSCVLALALFLSLALSLALVLFLVFAQVLVVVVALVSVLLFPPLPASVFLPVEVSIPFLFLASYSGTGDHQKVLR